MRIKLQGRYRKKSNGSRTMGQLRKLWLDRVDDILRKKKVRSLKNKRQCLNQCMDVVIVRMISKDRKL